MPGFVKGAEERLGQIIFTASGGDPHVVDGEFGGEGVVRRVEPPAREIVAEFRDALTGKGELRVLRVMPPQKAVIGFFAGAEMTHEWYEGVAQLGKQRFQLRYCHPVVVLGDERVGEVSAGSL